MPIIQTNQIADVLNTSASKWVGNTAVTVTDDLSNLADFGNAFEDLPENTRNAITGDLQTLIGTQIFKHNRYRGSGVNLTKASGEDGISQHIRMKTIQAKNDPSYDPTNGSTNDTFVNNTHEFEATYYMNSNAYMFEWSIPDNWYLGFFKDPMGAINLLNQTVSKSITIHKDVLSVDVMNSATALTLAKGQTHQVVNLLTEYNNAYGTTMTKSEALKSADFLKYAIFTINKTMDKVKDYNPFTNIKGWHSQAYDDSMHVIFNSQFINRFDTFLLSDLRQPQFMKLPNYKTVYKWSATGDGTFDDLTSINVKITPPGESTPITVNKTGIVGIIASADSMQLYNNREITTSQYDPKGLKTNKFTHLHSSTLIDPYEDYVVFIIEEPEVKN